MDLKFKKMTSMFKKLFSNKETDITAEIKSKIVLADTYLNNSFHIETQKATQQEIEKRPFRYDIINEIISSFPKERNISYLEIGVRNPEENFDKIMAADKSSVDPGIEAEINKADFPYTSDDFFTKLESGEIAKYSSDYKFDVIFIDGLHLANQVERDIFNALNHIKDDGFIIMHDCNPPTEFHAAENYYYRLSPSKDFWNGTTWKAFFKYRQLKDIFSCCIDTDWGIGIICKHKNLGYPTKTVNPFFEYYIFNENRKDSLNLISFDDFQKILHQ